MAASGLSGFAKTATSTSKVGKLPKYQSQVKTGSSKNGSIMAGAGKDTFVRIKPQQNGGDKVSIIKAGENSSTKSSFVLGKTDPKEFKSLTQTTKEGKQADMAKWAKDGKPRTDRHGNEFVVKDMGNDKFAKVYTDSKNVKDAAHAKEGRVSIKEFDKDGKYAKTAIDSKTVSETNKSLGKGASSAGNASKGSRVKGWVKEHPYWSAAIGVGTLGLGYVLYKQMSGDSQGAPSGGAEAMSMDPSLSTNDPGMLMNDPGMSTASSYPSSSAYGPGSASPFGPTPPPMINY